MKIFIAEYIICYETFLFDFLEENNINGIAYDYINYYESLSNLDNRFAFKNYYYPYEVVPPSRYLRKKQYAHDFFWRRKILRAIIFEKLLPIYFIPRKWLRRFYARGTLPMCYLFHQFGYLNDLISLFQLNHQEIMLFRHEFPKYECSLIFNHAHHQFPKKVVWLFEHKHYLKKYHVVLYRTRPYINEYLRFYIRYVVGGAQQIALVPGCRFLTTGPGIIYAKKWLYYTYHFFNPSRPQPWVAYAFWTENFFTEVFHYRVISYRFEFYRDSISLLGPLVGSTEVIQMYLYFFLRMYFYYVFLIFFGIFYGVVSSREKLLKLILFEEHLAAISWLYAVFFNHMVTVQSAVRQRNMKILKAEGRTLERKSQLESRIFKFFKNWFYIPLIVYYLENFVNTKTYRDWIEKCFLGDVKDYNTENTYIYVILMIFTAPFRLFSTFKTLFYRIHIFYYLKLNNIFRYSFLYNARSNYSFNRFFSNRIVHLRELDRYSAFDILERIVNYINIYSKKEYRDMANEFITNEYLTNLHARSSKRKQEYWEYFYFRTFGNYDPEVEYFQVWKSRFFTRWWYYSTDFSFNLLSTHQLYMFFNYIHSPLHIRFNSSSVYNFYYILFYSGNYFYYYYYLYYFFPKFININFFFLYIPYAISMLLNLISVLHNNINFIFDGRSRLLIKYFWKDYIHVCYLWLKKKYFFIKYFEYLILFFFFTIYYIFLIFFVYIKLGVFFILSRLFNFFSYFINTDLGFSYSFWHRYYMLKFYLIEYNIIYSFYVFLRNFFFNFLLILFIFFILTTIPYFKDLILSDYLVYYIYSFINKLFLFNKWLYFDYVLGQWWTLYFDPGKFIIYYNLYCNVFDTFLREIIGDAVIYSGHLGKRRFQFHPIYFDVFFRKYLVYLKLKKYPFIFGFFRKLFPGSFPWELYFYMHGYYLLVGHPAKRFMPEIYYHTLPIMLTYVWRYKYILFITKVLAPVIWFWKYSYSYIVFTSLMYFHDTIFFDIVFKIVKTIYDIYSYLNYFFLYFCYYYYYQFFFKFSRFIRYYLVTYDALYYFWTYRSARLIVSFELFSFFRICLDSVYFIFIEFFYGFFYSVYKIMHFIINFLGLASMYNYFSFSMNFIPKIHIFISELFDKFITINYELDEYGRILSKHFRGRTRLRVGEFHKRDMVVRSFYKMVHRTISFEFKFRQFLFYNKGGLMKNFLIYNSMKINTFNMFFFSFLSLYLNYILLLFCFTIFSLKMRILFKDDSHVNASPFYEWERFTTKNRHLMGRDEFYWLYNIRWLKNFEFYHDKYFTDDLYIHIFHQNDVKFGYYLYNSLTKFFITNEPYLFATMNENRFLLYKRYYLERYISIIKDIDFIFHEYSISNKKTQSKIFSFYDFFIPKFEKDAALDFKYDFVKGLGYVDMYWFYFGTPQLFYTRNWNFVRVMSREALSREFYAKLKKSLFKAYSLYEMNRNSVQYDFFEFQFFEPEFYDDVLYENISAKASAGNYFLHRIALSRWNTELVYTTPGKNFREIYAHVGYHDLVDKTEYFFEYLRGLNSRYLAKFMDFSLFSFVEPVHFINTHLDADAVKNTIDLSVSDNAVGIKYSELYQYEDLGRVATEQYLFNFLDTAFTQSREDPSVNVVALTDDVSLSHKHNSTWPIVVFLLPIIMCVIIFQEHLFLSRVILPHVWFREALSTILYRLLLPEHAEIILFHKFLTWEHMEHFYWANPFIWIRTHVFELFYIDNHSFWEGKHARFLQSKTEYQDLYLFFIYDDFLYDNISFLLWTFYVEGWRQCPDTVIVFVLWEFFIYLLFILFFLFIFNFALRLMDLYHYVSKKVHLVLDKDYDINVYRDYEEKKRQEREKRKNAQFDFFNLDVFTRFKGNVDKYQRKTKIKK